MSLFGIVLGGFLALVGVATFIFAPIVGPNPVFGVRIGYAYANRETWDKTNRFGGALLALVGVLVLMVAAILQALNTSTGEAINVLTGVMMLALVAALAAMTWYARGLAQASPAVREFAPVKFRWTYLAPVVIAFALLALFIVVIYPTLPANRVPSHFNLREQADGWQTRDEFVATFLGMGAFFVVLNFVIVFVATREPLVVLGRWGANWRLDPARGLVLTSVVFASLQVFFLVLLFNIWWFTTRGVLAFPFAWLVFLLVPLIIGIVILFFVLARRET